MENNTIFFINPGQFGYKAGYFYYCKYLIELGYNVRFLCFDQGHPKILLEGVHVKYVPFYRNKIKRMLVWLKIVFSCLRVNKDPNNIFFINQFKFCVIFAFLFPKANKVLDIRTGSLNSNPLRNAIQNYFLRFTALSYSHVTILSKGLISILKLNPKKCHLLPLGADILSDRNKTFENLNLLYVGSLNKRRIDQTIFGLKLFINITNLSSEKISYEIFGDGSKSEIESLFKMIQKHNLQGIVEYHGRKSHEELKPYFDECNIGVSYVPITPFFEHQPATKTFEYILSGMICVATKTFENKQIVTDVNGILCEDTADSFANSLLLISKRNDFNSGKIRDSLRYNTWEHIVRNNLHPYFNSIFEKRNLKF